MSKILSLVAVAAIASGCASHSTQPATVDVVAEDEPKTEMRCKYVKTTSSRLGQKVCEKVSD